MYLRTLEHRPNELNAYYHREPNNKEKSLESSGVFLVSNHGAIFQTNMITDQYGWDTRSWGTFILEIEEEIVRRGKSVI